jgi:hypothetical protein
VGGESESCKRTREALLAEALGEHEVAREIMLEEEYAKVALAKIHRQGGPTDTSVGNNPPVGPGPIARVPASRTAECLKIAEKNGETSPQYESQCGPNEFVIGPSATLEQESTPNSTTVTTLGFVPVVPRQTVDGIIATHMASWNENPTPDTKVATVAQPTTCSQTKQNYGLC